MFRFPGLNNLRAWACSRKDYRLPKAHQRRSIRLMLEALEDRVVPADMVITTVNNLTAFFTPNSQTLTVTATVADKTNPNVIVNKGVLNIAVPGEEPFEAQVNGGKAQTTVNLSSFPPGTYSISAIYSDDSGAFTDGGDNAGTLTIVPANVNTKADNDSTIYSTNKQTVRLTASVTDASIPADTVDEGTVRFSFPNIAVPDVKGTVSKGRASAIFTIPAGQTVDKYAFSVSYTDSAGNFTDGGDTNGTLSITPAAVTTTADNITVNFRPKPRQLAITLTATLSDNDFPADIVNSGAVTFTVLDATRTAVGNPVTGNVKFDNQKATASANILLPAGQAAGKYTIVVSFKDSKGNFTEGGENDGTLTINPAAVAPKGKKVNAIFNPNAQTVTLSADVPDISDPSDTVDEGTVTFIVPGIGTVQGAVSNGIASAEITIPGNEPTGDYPFAVSYSDSSGDFVDSGDTGGTLSITPCTCATTSAAAANQMTQNLASYFANLEAQLFQDAQAVLNSFAAVMQGQQPLSALVQSLVQFYQLSFAFQAVAQEPTLSPEAFGATGGGEFFAAPSGAVPE